MTGTDHPIEGEPLMLATARASVGPAALPRLLDDVQSYLAARRDDYRAGYERALETDAWEAFFVERGHWEQVGSALELGRREHEAVARAHREQLLWAGRSADRREEFETALDLREVAVVGR
ncbi:hypothetical protein [Halorarius halobius]|uniref:hypothetical protein n=1 Tax=Halorarius halobius TaxID=2962671 RepID=UPI0020CEDB40|nr:hypothetical protein [Halorarius halobius]